VLIPNDKAFSDFTAENPSISTDQEALLALLQYHVANGTHPSATFGLAPLFVPTLLTNPNYTNVTGGQVVEMARLNDTPTIVTGVKAESHFVEAVSTGTYPKWSQSLLTRAGYLFYWGAHTYCGFRIDHSHIPPRDDHESRTEQSCGTTQQRRLADSEFSCSLDCQQPLRLDSVSIHVNGTP
jgi:hypothetical protein